MPADTAGALTIPDGLFTKEGAWVLPPTIKTGRAVGGALNKARCARHLIEDKAAIGTLAHAVRG